MSDASLTSAAACSTATLLSQDHPVASLMFCLIECAVGNAQELFDRLGIVRIHGDADGNGYIAQSLATIMQSDLTYHVPSDSARARASSVDSSGRITTNSSPPKRQTMSSLRTVSRRVPATSRKTTSPAS